MRICEICGAEIPIENEDEHSMTVLGVCESCRNDFIQQQE